jgi:hypothetical protein
MRIAAAALLLTAVARDALSKGRTVTVSGYPSREKAGEMRAERITAGGKTIELR